MNNQTKKIVQILVIIFFLAATIIIVFAMVSRNSRKAAVNNNVISGDIANLGKKMTTEEIEEMKNKAVTGCEKTKDEIATSTCADSVYSAEATKEKEVDACSLIEDKFLQASCFDATYLAIALGDVPNPSVCNYLSSKDQQIACADEANFRLAYQNKDQAREYCNKIITEATRKACSDKFSQ